MSDTTHPAPADAARGGTAQPPPPATGTPARTPKWPDDFDAETVAMSGGTGIPAMEWAARQPAPVAADGAPGEAETIEQELDGGWKVVVKPRDLSVVNPEGQIVGRFRNATMALASLAFVLQRLATAESRAYKLQAFKDYVHKRLDDAGVPHHPPGPHGPEGCRIGDRMDWLTAKVAAADGEGEATRLAQAIREALTLADDRRGEWGPLAMRVWNILETALDAPAGGAAGRDGKA